jgi:hypothetical protein
VLLIQCRNRWNWLSSFRSGCGVFHGRDATHSGRHRFRRAALRRLNRQWQGGTSFGAIFRLKSGVVSFAAQ